MSRSATEADVTATTSGPRQGSRRRERGHLMAGVVVTVALMSILSAVAVQEWAEVLRRDNEAEMIFRAQEIVRGIQRYRVARGGQGPLKLEDLMEPGPRGQYFMRRLYVDPLVPDGVWGLLHVGPGNQIVDPNSEDATDPTGAGGLGSRSKPFGRDDSRSQLQRRRQERLGRLGLGNRGSGQDRGGRGAQQTGLPIAGIKSLATDKPFRVYNGLTEYSQWLFTYFDLETPQVPGGGGAVGKPGGPGGAPGVGTPGAGAGGAGGVKPPGSRPPISGRRSGRR